MKRAFLLLLVTLPTAVLGRGLSAGDKSLEISAAVADLKGISAELHYASLIRQRMELGFSLSALGRIYDKEEYRIPVIQAGATLDFSHILISAKRSTLALWIDAGALLGYESVNMEEEKLPDGAVICSKSTFLWGLIGSMRLEIPLGKKTAISLRFRERYTPPSQVSQFHSEIGLGFRITL